MDFLNFRITKSLTFPLPEKVKLIFEVLRDFQVECEHERIQDFEKKGSVFVNLIGLNIFI